MSYTAQELKHVLRQIITHGIEVNPAGVVHKRNTLDPAAPKLPIKIHLCTAEMRPPRYAGDPRLPQKVFEKMTQLMLRFLKAHGMPRISGIPNVGAGIVREMYRAEFHEGRNLRIVRLTKERLVFRCVMQSESQELWGIDDLLNLGDTKLRAVQAWQAAGYKVRHLLTFLDYGRGGRLMLEKAGIEAYNIATVSALLLIAEQEPDLNPALTPTIIAQTREIIATGVPTLNSAAA